MDLSGPRATQKSCSLQPIAISELTLSKNTDPFAQVTYDSLEESSQIGSAKLDGLENI